MSQPDARTAGTCLAQGRARLAAADVEAAPREARLLLAAATARPPEWLFAHPRAEIGGEEAARFESYLDRRAAGEPLSRILGRREFWSLDLEITPDVLDPRADSESLIEAVLAARAGDPPARFLDLGTGSGCLLLALLAEWPRAYGLGVDWSPATLEVARQNAERLGFGRRAGFLAGDWASALVGSWEVILANPPYIPSAAMAGLAPAVRLYDPATALDGGADGLAAYRRLIPQAVARLAPGGLLALEIGADQASAVAELLNDAGLWDIALGRDLAGRPRCVTGQAPATAEAGHEKRAWKAPAGSLM